MTSCVWGRGGQPKTDEVDFLLNKKFLLCSEETDMGGRGGKPKTDET